MLDASGVPSSLSRKIIRGILREEWGYPGAVISDDLDMGAVGYGFARRSAIMQALEAGNDALMVRNRRDYDPALPATIASWISRLRVKYRS